MEKTRPIIGAIIQARLSSERLPRKILKQINGKPILEHLVERVNLCNLVNKIIIACPHSPECCLNETIFIGSECDVLDRYYKAAIEHSLDVIVRLTSDCPFIPPYEINRVISAYLDSEYHYVTNIGNQGRFGTPDGWDVEVFSFECLESAWKQATNQYDREHVTSWIKNSEYSKLFLHPIKLSIDTEEDYKRLKDFYQLEYPVLTEGTYAVGK